MASFHRTTSRAILLLAALLMPTHAFNTLQNNSGAKNRSRRMPPLFYTDIEPEIRSITIPPIIYVNGKPIDVRADDSEAADDSVATPRERKSRSKKRTKGASTKTTKSKTTVTKSSTKKEKKTHETVWHRSYADLQQYKEEHGNCLVPQNYPENKKLGLWVMQQRRQYTLMQQGKKSSLSGKRGEYRLRLLEEIGFVWRLDRRGPRGSYGSLRRVESLSGGHEIHTVKNFEQYMIEKGANYNDDEKRDAWLKRFEVLR